MKVSGDEAPDDIRMNHAVALNHVGRVRDGWQVWSEELAQQQRRGRVKPHTLSNMAFNRGITGRAQAARDFALQSVLARARDETPPGARVLALNILARSEQHLGHWRRALSLLEGLESEDTSANPHKAWSVRMRRCENWLDLGQFARAGRELTDISGQPDLHFKFTVTALCELARARRWAGQAVDDCLHRASALLPSGSQADLRLRVEWEALHFCPADHVQARSEMMLSEAQAPGMEGIVMAAWWLRAARLRELSPPQAADAAEHALAMAPDIDTFGLYKPELWWHAALALRAAGQAERAASCVHQAATWIHARVQQGDVPAEFIDSFLHRNPINRELLAWAGRLGVSAAA